MSATERTVSGEVRFTRLTIGEFAGAAYIALYLIVKFEPFVLLRPLPGSAASLLLPMAGVCALAIAPTEGLRRIPINFALVGLIAWMAASYLWAESTLFAFVILRNELPSLLMLWLVVGSMRPRLAVSTLLGAFGFFAVWSLGTSLTLPMSRAAVLFDGPAGLQEGWRGTFDHKNLLGIYMVLALSLTLAFYRRRSRPLMIGLIVSVILSTRSATAASGLVAVVATWFLMTTIGRTQVTRDRVILKILAISSLVAAIGLVIGTLPVLVGVYGKDLTFSGRTEIWAASLDAALRRPIQGYGIGGVWFDVRSPVTIELHRAIGFGASHAHNGPLNMFIEAGIVGLGMYLVVLIQTVRLAVRSLGGVPEFAAYGRWAITTIAAVQLMALSEPLYRGPLLGLAVVMWTVLARVDQDRARGAAGVLARSGSNFASTSPRNALDRSEPRA